MDEFDIKNRDRNYKHVLIFKHSFNNKLYESTNLFVDINNYLK